MGREALRLAFGDIDIYLFDQILRGRFDQRRRVLDAGCGDGRNLVYLLRDGCTCFAADRDPAAVDRVSRLADALSNPLAPGHAHVGELDALLWPAASVDAVICSAILHFAADEDHFGAMLGEMWRVLAPGGLLFTRLASSIGIEARLECARGRTRLPDGSVRFVVDESMLLDLGARLEGRLLDPIKTTNVQGQRCMTTWCLEKPAYTANPASPTRAFTK